jgi:hypothetical protein
MVALEAIIHGSTSGARICLYTIGTRREEVCKYRDGMSKI